MVSETRNCDEKSIDKVSFTNRKNVKDMTRLLYAQNMMIERKLLNVFIHVMKTVIVNFQNKANDEVYFFPYLKKIYYLKHFKEINRLQIFCKFLFTLAVINCVNIFC